MDDEKCEHLVIGYSDLTAEKKLFGNQLENFMGKNETIAFDEAVFSPMGRN